MQEAQPARTTPDREATNVTGLRIVAALIDVALLVGVFIILALLIGDSESTSGDEGFSFNVQLDAVGTIVYVAFVYGYYFLLETLTGQTLGKMIMGLRVVALEGSLSAGKVAVRTLLRIIDGLPLLYLVGLITVAASKDHQRLGDMAAGTSVVRA